MISKAKIESDDLVENLTDTLLGIMEKLGIRAVNLPTKEEMPVLLHHVTENYKFHTLHEIRLAFDMAITGQLDVDPKCYENFSCAYFSLIMGAYRKWTSEAVKQIQVEKPEQTTSDLTYENWIEDLRKTKIQLEFLPLMVYDHLEAKGELEKTNDEKYAYLQRAVSYRQGKLVNAFNESMSRDNKEALEKFNAMKVNGCFEGEEIERLKNLAKRMILFDYLYPTT